MAVNKQLSRFVRDALSAGKTRAEISQALTDSGWSRSEVADALDAWAETVFAPPVPRPQATVSARDFFIYALTFGVMIFAAIHVVQLFHALIDFVLEENRYRWAGGIRWSMSVLIVTTPVYLWLTVRERRKLAEDPALHRSAIRRWLMYVTLLLSAAVMLGDGVAVIYAFLSGDFTLQFFLKALVVGGVAGMIFLFYLSDIRRGDRA
ncbi:hypothetical protein BOO69_04945 [Sulfitobacter alexandrii]|uniref:DUF5671 domain-containing protein n=1 Tax=Sulfitobacter alexandrii TaxID=1917485 RepID=A0A1J0WEW3_9RHOB|nr:DUF5671 domain-containing protein [Sulfitobacter alexandrii]APE42843.1 hypothetical protein BOO69_04945 [Sulfitobacter alexandrii]